MKVPELPAQFSKAYETFPVNLPGGFVIEPNYLSAGAIVFLLFLLILTLGQLRHRLLHWHIKGFMPGIIFGIIITLIFEGFALVGGHTIITGILGWENAPKPISVALDSGRNQLANVLGVSDVSIKAPECLPAQAGKNENTEITPKSVLSNYFKLDDTGRDTIQGQICE